MINVTTTIAIFLEPLRYSCSSSQKKYELAPAMGFYSQTKVNGRFIAIYRPKGAGFRERALSAAARYAEEMTGRPRVVDLPPLKAPVRPT